MEDVPLRGYAIAEEAALAGFPASSHPRVIRVERFDETQVFVYVDTEPSYLVRVTCELRENLWYDIGSG